MVIKYNSEIILHSGLTEVSYNKPYTMYAELDEEMCSACDCTEEYFHFWTARRELGNVRVYFFLQLKQSGTLYYSILPYHRKV